MVNSKHFSLLEFQGFYPVKGGLELGVRLWLSALLPLLYFVSEDHSLSEVGLERVYFVHHLLVEVYT